jgi:hypothetical protein
MRFHPICGGDSRTCKENSIAEEASELYTALQQLTNSYLVSHNKHEYLFLGFRVQ